MKIIPKGQNGIVTPIDKYYKLNTLKDKKCLEALTGKYFTIPMVIGSESTSFIEGSAE